MLALQLNDGPIIGIGVDMVDIERFRLSYERFGERLLARLFTSAEIECCLRRNDFMPCLAVRFAAKEAVAKSLGTGFRGFGPRDVEVRKNGQGAPRVVLHGKARELAGHLGITAVYLSLSHEGDRAVAFAIAVGGGRNAFSNGGGDAPD